MVRGVNRHIIEVVDTGSEHFERAILFVRQDSHRLDGEQLTRRAKACLGEMRMRPRAVRGRRWTRLLGWAAAFALGVAAGLLMFPLLGWLPG